MDTLYHAAFLALNASDDPSRIVVAIAILSAKVLYVVVPLHLALAWFGGTRSIRFIAVSGVLAIALALVASGLTGLVWYMPRPFVIGLGHTLIEHRPSSAFPSNHAIVCFAWAGTLALYGRAWLAYAVALVGIVVAWSRIYLGVHYPVDMLGAAAYSGVAAVAAGWVMARAGDRLLVLLEGAADRLFRLVPAWVARTRDARQSSGDGRRRLPQRALRDTPSR